MTTVAPENCSQSQADDWKYRNKPRTKCEGDKLVCVFIQKWENQTRDEREKETNELTTTWRNTVSKQHRAMNYINLSHAYVRVPRVHAIQHWFDDGNKHHISFCEKTCHFTMMRISQESATRPFCLHSPRCLSVWNTQRWFKWIFRLFAYKFFDSVEYVCAACVCSWNVIALTAKRIRSRFFNLTSLALASIFRTEKFKEFRRLHAAQNMHNTRPSVGRAVDGRYVMRATSWTFVLLRQSKNCTLFMQSSESTWIKKKFNSNDIISLLNKFFPS